MNFQQEVSRTINSKDQNIDQQVSNFALGMVCEAAEAGDICKKIAHHHHPLTEETLTNLMMEIGDALWYMYALAEVIGFDVEDCKTHVINKLRKRYPEGFSSEASINRTPKAKEYTEG